jgi:electron transfer flavoprotein beta subunit
MSRIAVLVSTRIDPVSGRATRSSADAAAVALALRQETQPLLLATADMSEPVAREYLGLGAPSLTRLATMPGDDLGGALASAAQAAPLLLCGAQAQGGLGSGLLPYQVAALLGRPLIPDVVEVQADGPGWLLRQALPRGARRRLRVGGAAVLVLGDRAPAAARYAWDAAQQGRIVTNSPAASPAANPAANLVWQAEAARKQLRPLAPRVQLSGHARMARAVGSGTASAGGRVLKDGSVDDKARALYEHLLQLGLLAASTRS